MRAADLEWTLDIASTPVTRVFNTVGATLPMRAWRSRPVLAVMSAAARLRYPQRGMFVVGRAMFTDART